jgi:DNA polymerase III, delta subunit
MFDFTVPRLEKLISQPEAEKLLKGFLAGRAVQSFLWIGPEGSGKKTHALALARTLFCMEGSECQGCPTCKQVLNKTHPDLFWVSRDHVWSEDAKDEKKQGIVVGVAKNLTDKLNRAPFSAPCKVAIIPEADSLNQDAQNVLLKTLEEPPANTIIILVAEKTSEFLPTVLSRCRLIRFAVLSNKVVEDILVKNHGWQTETAHQAALESNGNLVLAMKLGDEIWVSFRKKVCEDFDKAFQGLDEIWLDLGSEYDKWEPEFLGDEEITANQRKTRVHQTALQFYINLWSRRLVGEASIPAGLTNLPPEQILRCLQKHQDMIQSNLGTKMIMDHLFLELKEGLKKGCVDDRSFMELSVQI